MGQISLYDLYVSLKELGFDVNLVGDENKAREINIRDVTNTTKDVAFGSLYVCIKGKRFDGHDFAKEALEKGAVSFLCSKKIDVDIPYLLYSDVRKVYGYLSAFVYGWPADRLKGIGVTGTNGKTTTTFMIKSALEHLGKKTALIGTVYYYDGKDQIDADRTTPEASFLQKFLAKCLENGCEYFVMEASSHGIEMGRLDGIKLDAVAFTNLTPEHLDFHGTMEEYYVTKRRLFYEFVKDKAVAVINIDDRWGKRLYEDLSKENPKDLQLVSIGFKSSDADIKAVIDKADINGSLIQIKSSRFLGKESVKMHIPLVGYYNAYNALTAFSVLVGMGFSPEDVVLGIKSLKNVPGRVELIKFSNGAVAVIDYAHSPDALQKLIGAIKGICDGRISVVFGLGGHRYVQNRYVMGQIAAKECDYVVITMDNPRFEDPSVIASQIEEGVLSVQNRKGSYTIELNRKEAIRKAVRFCNKKGDAIIISGKGPETYMIIKDKYYPYNDKEALLEVLKEEGISVVD